MSTHSNFLFSVIIPIYRVEEFLAEAIDSVIGQDIGFKEHIQLILVNDGSPDNSEAICLRYQSQYPGNIIYLKQANAGVSAARNHGLNYAEGKYVNFLDGDDKWSLNAFSQVYRFFEKKQNELDLVACKMLFFDARTGDHPLNGKFTSERPERVIDLMNDHTDIQCHCTSSFIKTEVAKEHAFLPELKLGEDSLYINQIILRKRRFGALTNAIHHYRRRFDDSSAVQSQAQKPHWYNDAPRLYYDNLAKESIRLYGTVLPYIQYIIFYDLGYRLKTPLYSALSETERSAYLSYLSYLLKEYISDYIILSHKSHAIETRILALKFKYGDIRSHLSVIGQCLFFDSYKLVNLRKSTWMLQVTSLDIRRNKLYLYGILRRSILELLGEDCKLTFHSPGMKSRTAKLTPLPCVTHEDIYDVYDRYVSFSVTIPLDPSVHYQIKPILSFGGLYRCRLRVNFGQFTPMVTSLPHSFCHYGKYILEHNDSDLLISAPKDTKEALRRHNRLLYEDLRASGNEQMLSLRRKVVWLKRLLRLTKQKLWLISDRYDIAGDNGEAFFKYLCHAKPKGILPVFAVSKDSPDYQRMKQYGHVVDTSSINYKIALLAANKLISSSGTVFSYCPFETEELPFIRDLLRRNYVFLQHGITQNDVSGWLNRYTKDFQLICCVTPVEKRSIASVNYGYTDNTVSLVGFTRYDTLLQKAQQHPTKKQLLLLPTWRKALQSLPIADAENTNRFTTSSYRLGFTETEYYQFYNNLINHPRLLAAMRQHGYTGLFALHPSIGAQSKDFTSNDLITIHSGRLDYSSAFAESSILLTDYSSVAFDFAYLRRPVVYSQYDSDSFFQTHTVKRGYFNYDSDGFGPVCNDLESTVNALISLMERGAKPDTVYCERIDKFFPFNDSDNCKRTYEAIMKLK